MKRNDVVFCHSGATKNPPHFSPYGRIVKKIGDEFEVIFCDGERWTLAEDDLTVVNYGGRIEQKAIWAGSEIISEYFVFIPFPSLKKLKAIANRYLRAYGQNNMFDVPIL